MARKEAITRVLIVSISITPPACTVPYKSPHGFHRHKCGRCGLIWEHADTCAGNDDAHSCTGCGTEEWYKYLGNEPPTNQ